MDEESWCVSNYNSGDRSLSNDGTCPHYTVVRVPTRQEPSNPIAVARICLKCGAPFLLYPMNLKDNPDLEKALIKFAKEATGNIPKL